MLECTKTPLGYSAVYTHDVGDIYLDLTRMREKDEHIVGVLKIRALSGGRWYHLFVGSFNVTSSNSRKQTTKHIQSLVKGSAFEQVEWDILLERFAAEVYKKHFEPQLAEPLEEFPENPSISYLLYPILPQNVPSLIYAPGGAGKSMFALYVAVLLQSGYDFYYNKQEPVNVLYVDWELDKQLMSARYSQMVIEEVEEKKPPLYLRATHTLSDEIGNILTNIQEHSIKLVILDSAAPAIGGDINDAGAVIRFFQEIRKITEMNVTVLILTHVSKAHKEREDGAMPVGSVFFENLARMTWELKCWKHPAFEKTYVYALYNRKSNFGHHEPVGIRIRWQDGLAFIETTNLEAENAITGSTLKDMVLALLYENDEISATELAKTLGTTKQTIWNILSDLKKQGLVEPSQRGYWRAIK